MRYGDILEAADRHAVFKQCLKETADCHGVSVTFMAKPHGDRAGSSRHVHLSLWEAGATPSPATRTSGGRHGRIERAWWFLGGCLRWVPELVCCWLPR